MAARGLELLDVTGRLLWQRSIDHGTDGWTELPWPTEALAGSNAGRGILLLRARSAGEQASIKVVYLE